MMVTEQEVWDIVSQMPGTFLARWVAFAGTRVDSPLAYHLLSGLTMMGAAAHVSLIDYNFPGGRAVPVLWGIMVGRSGIDRKSTACFLAQDLFTRALPNLLGAEPRTGEGLRDALQVQPQQMIVMDELGKLFSTFKAQYAEQLKPMLLAGFDAREVWKEVKSKRNIVEIRNPRLSLLGGINPALVRDGVTVADWEGGLMSRFLIFYAQREASLTTFPPFDHEEFGELAELLGWQNQILPGPALGPTPEAQEMWTNWVVERDSLIENETRAAIQSVHSRVPMMAYKVAIILTMNAGKIVSNMPWEIGAEEMRLGIEIANLHYRSAVYLASTAQADKEMQLRQRVLDAIPTNGQWVAWGKVIKASQMLSDTAEKVYRTLIAEGTIESRFTPRMEVRVAGGATPVEETPDMVEATVGAIGGLMRWSIEE